MERKPLYVYMSCWSEHNGKPGLAKYTMDRESGELQFEKMLNEDISFNYSYLDQKRGIYYICNETNRVEGIQWNTGRIYGYKLNKDNGDLEELFHIETGCPNPSQVTIDKSGKYMIVSHHSDSSRSAVHMVKDENGEWVPEIIFNDALVELYEVKEDGRPGKLLDVKNQNTEEKLYDRHHRLGCAHPHCTALSPSGKLIAVCDKGDSRIWLYTIDEQAKELKLLSRTVSPDGIGAAPRYAVFHPTQPWLFINHEVIHKGRMTVAAYRYTEDGTLELINTANAIPEDTIVPEGYWYEQQDFCMDSDGKHLYSVLGGSNYSPNAVAVFEINQENGEVRRIQNIPMDGKRPRGGALTPDGRFYIASSMASGELNVYRVGADGMLTDTGFRGNERGVSYFNFYDPEKDG